MRARFKTAKQIWRYVGEEIERHVDEPDYFKDMDDLLYKAFCDDLINGDIYRSTHYITDIDEYLDLRVSLMGDMTVEERTAYRALLCYLMSEMVNRYGYLFKIYVNKP